MGFEGFKNPIGAESGQGEEEAKPFSKLEKAIDKAGELAAIFTKGLKFESMSPEEKREMMGTIDSAIAKSEEKIGQLATRFSQEGGERKGKSAVEKALREEEEHLGSLKDYKKYLSRDIAGDKAAT